MRLINRHQLHLPVPLWRDLVRATRLDGVLPEAKEKPCLFPKHGQLQIFVRKRLWRRKRLRQESGHYAMGSIALLPCPYCTPAFLTKVLLHELFHGWVDQHRGRDLYFSWDHCGAAEAFADAGFADLGGRTWKRGSCRQHAIDARKHEPGTEAVGRRVRRLDALTDVSLKAGRWKRVIDET